MQNHDRHIPDNYHRLVEVNCLKDLFDTASKLREDDPRNVILLKREIEGDFNALANDLECKDLRSKLDEFSLIENWKEIYNEAKNYPIRVQEAINQIIEDQRELDSFINRYILKSIPNTGYLETDSEVYSFHDDIVKWRLMSCYNGPVTEWISNEDSYNCGMFASDAGYFMLKDEADDSKIYHFKPGDIWLHSGNLRNLHSSFIHRAPKEEGACFPRIYLVGTPKFCN